MQEFQKGTDSLIHYYTRRSSRKKKLENQSKNQAHASDRCQFSTLKTCHPLFMPISSSCHINGLIFSLPARSNSWQWVQCSSFNSLNSQRIYDLRLLGLIIGWLPYSSRSPIGNRCSLLYILKQFQPLDLRLNFNIVISIFY